MGSPVLLCRACWKLDRPVSLWHSISSAPEISGWSQTSAVRIPWPCSRKPPPPSMVSTHPLAPAWCPHEKVKPSCQWRHKELAHSGQRLKGGTGILGALGTGQEQTPTPQSQPWWPTIPAGFPRRCSMGLPGRSGPAAPSPSVEAAVCPRSSKVTWQRDSSGQKEGAEPVWPVSPIWVHVPLPLDPLAGHLC